MLSRKHYFFEDKIYDGMEKIVNTLDKGWNKLIACIENDIDKNRKEWLKAYGKEYHPNGELDNFKANEKVHEKTL